MQLADSVSVAKIKIIYASRQRAHSEPSALIWRSCAFNRGPMTMPVLDGPMTMPVLDGVKPMAITLPICGTSESLFWKRKKNAYVAGLEQQWNLNIWRVRWPSPRQVRVQIPTSPRQVRDDRKTSRDRTRVLQPYVLMSLFTVHDSTRTRFNLCAMQCTYTAKGNSSLIRCWTPLKCPDITEGPSYDWAIMGMSFKPHDCNPSLIPETIPAASRELEQSTKQINRSLIWSPSVYLMQTESCSVFDDFASSAITARKPV